MGKSSGSAPAGPDPNVTIPLQAKYNQQALDATINASRINSNSPTGSTTWTKTTTPGKTATPVTPGASISPLLAYAQYGQAATPQDSGPTDIWTENKTLSPNQQAIFNANEGSQLKQSQLLDALTGRLSSTVGKPIDYSGAPALVGSLGSANLRNPTQRAINPGELPDAGDPITGGQLPTAGDVIAGGKLPSAGDPITGGKLPTTGTMGADLASELSGYKSKIGGLDPLAFNQQAADAIYNQSTRYLDPQVQQQQSALEARLGEQGFVPGTPGYQQAMMNFQDTNARAYADARDRATTQGTSVGNQAFGSSLSGVNSQIAAALQGNQAGLNTIGADAALQGQDFTQRLNSQNQNFGQNLALQGQDFTQRLNGQNQNFDQNLVAQGQDFTQRLNSQNQNFGQNLTRQGQDFNQQSSLADRDRQQGIDANTTAQQTFANNSQAAGFRNNARTQSIAELLQQRQQPINELNAIRSGTQVDVPAPASGTVGGPSAQPVDALGAYNNQYQGQIGAYNAQVGSDNANTAAGAQLGAAALLAFFSDARLKSDVNFVGKTEGGANLYDYTIFDRRERGVMAQELLETQPDAVHVDPESGFYLVDYSKVK